MTSQTVRQAAAAGAGGRAVSPSGGQRGGTNSGQRTRPSGRGGDRRGFASPGRGKSPGATGAKGPPKREIVKTWAFDSVGPRKYALQIQRASNGNPCLLIVEGVPPDDGAYRKFNITVWSEDFPRLFSMLDEVRTFIQENNIRTPDGHKYEPRPREARR